MLQALSASHCIKSSLKPICRSVASSASWWTVSKAPARSSLQKRGVPAVVPCRTDRLNDEFGGQLRGPPRAVSELSLREEAVGLGSLADAPCHDEL